MSVQPTINFIKIKVVIKDNKPALVISGSRSQGPPGEPGIPGPAGDIFRINFAFDDGFALSLIPLEPGELIIDTELVIEIPYDDPAATLQLGLLNSPNEGIIFKTNQLDPSDAGQYRNPEHFSSPISEQVVLRNLPGTSTQGSGYVLIAKI